MYENSTLSINVETLRLNIDNIFKQLNGTTLIPVLKANAYGHGLVKIGKLLSEDTRIRRLAVAHLSEAIELRENGITLPIMVLSGILLDDLVIAKNYNIEISAYNQEVLDKAITLDLGYHLKINTGLHRLGFSRETLITLKNIKPISTYSHFVQGVIENSSLSFQQDEYFTECIELLKKNHIDPGFIHICDSGAYEWFNQAHYDAVRIGRALYMDNPNKPEIDRHKDVATWSAAITHIFKLPKETPFGYNQLYYDNDKTIGILNVGYGDGIISKDMPILINNQRTFVLDSAMDQSYIDLSNINATINDTVEIYGETLSTNIYAKTINDEGCALTTSLTHRVKRLYTLK